MLLFLLDSWPRTPGTCVRREMVLLRELVWERRVKDREGIMVLFPLIRGWRRQVEFIIFFFVVIANEFTLERIYLSVTARRR